MNQNLVDYVKASGDQDCVRLAQAINERPFVSSTPKTVDNVIVRDPSLVATEQRHLALVQALGLQAGATRAEITAAAYTLSESNPVLALSITVEMLSISSVLTAYRIEHGQPVAMAYTDEHFGEASYLETVTIHDTVYGPALWQTWGMESPVTAKDVMGVQRALAG